MSLSSSSLGQFPGIGGDVARFHITFELTLFCGTPFSMFSIGRVFVGDEVTEDKALGGAVAFGTGIAEVELPIEYVDGGLSLFRRALRGCPNNLFLMWTHFLQLCTDIN